MGTEFLFQLQDGKILVMGGGDNIKYNVNGLNATETYTSK
jgi:hypothetical protein